MQLLAVNIQKSSQQMHIPEIISLKPIPVPPSAGVDIKIKLFSLGGLYVVSKLQDLPVRFAQCSVLLENIIIK